MDFSKVTTLQIPEGNVTKIEDKEGNILWANINKLAYGVRWNSVNQATTACERIGNLELHKTLPIQSRFKVCIHKGKEIQYYCNPIDSRFVEESKRSQFTYQGTDLNITACDGLPAGVVSCEENSIVKCKFINTTLFSNYRFLYSYVYVRDNINKNNIAIGRIVYINTSTGEAYIDDSDDIASGDYGYTDNDYRFWVYNIIDTQVTDFTNNCTVELGCSINGYDGEIGVDTGGKFYQWSVDKDGAGNEVWQSLYKCVSYAREIKRHIIGIGRTCVLNVAFNDPKWGWVGSLEANTAVNVINYHTNLRGGKNNTDFDKYLGVDNFRCQLGKGIRNANHNNARIYSRKTDGGQMLYKQIWEAIVWCYVIEYADFDAKKAYNPNLTAEGYHQGGLGDSVENVINNYSYTSYQNIIPNDYTLNVGNNTGIRTRAAKQFDIPVAANHYWDNYNINNVVATKSSDNKILTITSTKVLTTNQNIWANGNVVGSVTKYKITGLTDDQTVVFKREQGNLTITADGTYDVNWGTNNVPRKIYFGKLQTECNITIEIISAPAYSILENQISLNVPHWRGFNGFWYEDVVIIIDNAILNHDSTDNNIYYSDDISNFDSNINNKEHKIKTLSALNGDAEYIKELRITDKGDIVPSEVSYDHNYKGGYIAMFLLNNMPSLCANSTQNIIDMEFVTYPIGNFVKVTILDD